MLRQKLPGLLRAAEQGVLKKIIRIPRSDTPEAMVLGMKPGLVEMAQGPLTVSALGADPPARSTHFHLSPMSVVDGMLRQHETDLPAEQVDLVMSLASKLNTKTLTVVPGEGFDHGLVWEGVGDLGTTPPNLASGKPVSESLPEGDNEVALRRFVDDSVNILSELEFNVQRVDEGLLPINILWPWGHGVRIPLPNLALQRGEPVRVFSPSLRLAGLTRLVGYKHGDRRIFGTDLNTPWNHLRDEALNTRLSIIWSPAFSRFRQLEMLEEAGWLTKRIDEEFIAPLLDIEEPLRLSIIAPSAERNGLAVIWEVGMESQNHLPFDERSMDEPLTSMNLHELVLESIAPR